MIRLVLVAALVLLGDVATKVLAARCLGEKIVRLGALVELRCMRNPGMALGIFSDQRALALLLPVLTMLCAVWLIRRYRLTAYTSTCWGLVVGGSAGNFLQRTLSGYVLDMIFFPWLPWFVCNVADICICFGVALLAVSVLARPGDWEEKRRTKDANH